MLFVEKYFWRDHRRSLHANLVYGEYAVVGERAGKPLVAFPEDEEFGGTFYYEGTPCYLTATGKPGDPVPAGKRPAPQEWEKEFPWDDQEPFSCYDTDGRKIIYVIGEKWVHFEP